jgi:ubiquinone/menaquinone biosynthesis C-methylase UbiE
MTSIWSKLAGTAGDDALEYWNYFGLRLVERAAITPGARILDVGCGTGPSLFPAAARAGQLGQAIGIDICPT